MARVSRLDDVGQVASKEGKRDGNRDHADAYRETLSRGEGVVSLRQRWPSWLDGIGWWCRDVDGRNPRGPRPNVTVDDGSHGVFPRRWWLFTHVPPISRLEATSRPVLGGWPA